MYGAYVGMVREAEVRSFAVDVLLQFLARLCLVLCCPFRQRNQPDISLTF